MSGVLLPIRLCSPTVQELKHRRVVGQALEVDSDSDNSESESSDDSAANEYAEGLGFADRRREAVSNFEFDHHPREEYFEEPKSWDGDVGRCSMQPVRESKRPISSVLRDLEAQEERELKRARQSLRGQAAQGAMPQMQTSSRGKEHWAELRAYGACLALLRQRFHREGLKEGWELEALRVLKALGSFKIGVSELQSTGLGREVSKSVWQKNRSREVSRLSRRLLKDWRRSAGLPSLRRRSANHANSNLSISSRVGRETS